MRRSILKQFIFILVISMLVSGFFFYLTVSEEIQTNTEEDLVLTLEMLDELINYESPLQEQIIDLPTSLVNRHCRITIFDIQGNVYADSDISDYLKLENHSQREEVKEASQDGTGFSTRYSTTLNTKMLYTAVKSSNADYILRIAIPFSGMLEYLNLLLPAIIISIGIAAIIAVIMAEKTTKSIVRPLNEITSVMENCKDESQELEFMEYNFNELNVITETVKRMSQSMKKYINDIEFEKMVRQEFFTNVSHELKTPITSIRGYTELLKNGFAPDEETKNEFMDRILVETEHMASLINDILMISRLETHETEVISSELRISIILNDVIESFIPLARENKIELITECKPLIVLANEGHMKELLRNLIGNAIKYNRQNGKVYINISSQQKDFILTVTDTGVGIPEDSKNRVFERFYRVDRGRSKKVGGTGLGLSIVKHIVNHYGGNIILESNLNEGSKFTVLIPNTII